MTNQVNTTSEIVVEEDDEIDIKQQTRLQALMSQQQQPLSTPLLTDEYNNPNTSIIRGTQQPQPPCCAHHDIMYSFLFLLHYTCLLYIVFVYGVPALSDAIHGDIEQQNYVNYVGFVRISMIACLLAFFVTSLCISFMISSVSSRRRNMPSNYEESNVIVFALSFSIVTSFILSVILFFIQEQWLGIITGMVCLSSILYTIIIYPTISFASINITIGIRAVRDNTGLIVAAYAILSLAVFYTAFWCIAMIGLYQETLDQDDDCSEKDCNEKSPRLDYIIMLFFNFFWTQQVVMNIIHVTVAGTIRTWWFEPDNEASSTTFCCCSASVSDSLFGAMTYSFGSICLGSLTVTIISIVRQLIEYSQFTENDENDENDENTNGCILCCACDCMGSCLDSIFRSFNKWAYCYIGIYGYDFVSSSQRTMALFEARGWTAIISNDVISNSLGFITLVVGLMTGLMALLILNLFEKEFQDATEWKYNIFSTGFMIGLSISSIMLGVIESAVNSIMVLFAEAPFEFELNHNDLFLQMRNSWRETYPNICGF